MLFSSIIFILFFLPVVFAGYYLLSFSRRLQNILLFIASIMFYAWGEPIYVFLMLTSILVNWFFGLSVSRVKKQEQKKRILILSCVFNLGILFVFKYLGFVIRNINLVGNILPQPDIALPIGISFFTFQAMSYVIDVYRNTTEAEKNPFYVGLYISFFPQLIAGPIIKYHSVAMQIRHRKSSWRKCSVGICRFSTGLGKKILISNNMAILADHIFSWSSMGQEFYTVPAMLAWLGCIAYTLQIYFDFSGYSDMAIGLGLMFGFEFDENFNYPYAAASITDFWRRWHISLTSWFREYVYFPLGGSRVDNKDFMVRNMFIVWLLTGIWHGAEWTFLFWGLWHFLFQLAERFFGYADKWKSRPFMHIYTLLVVSFGWVLFRAQDLYQAGRYFMNMFALNRNGIYSGLSLYLLREYWVFLAAAVIFSLPLARIANGLLAEKKMGVLGKICSVCYPLVMGGMVLLCIACLVRGSYNPFIYFNF